MERIPYPVDEDGVPYAPQDIGQCYEECLKGAKSTNRHHLGYPRKEYTTATEKAYRESGSMVVRACICKHEELHHTYEPPAKPSVQVMRDVAQGDIHPREAQVWIKTKSLLNLENIV